MNPDKLDGSAREIFDKGDWRQESGPLEPISEPQLGVMPAGHGKSALAGHGKSALAGLCHDKGGTVPRRGRTSEQPGRL